MIIDKESGEVLKLVEEKTGKNDTASVRLSLGEVSDVQ